MFLNCSTCLQRHTAHHQELKSCNCSLWFYIRLWLPVAVMVEPWQLPATTNVCEIQRLQLQLLSSWWWAVCRWRHVEQLRNTGIINSTTRSHLVCYFYTIYKNVSPIFYWSEGVNLNPTESHRMLRTRTMSRAFWRRREEVTARPRHFTNRSFLYFNVYIILTGLNFNQNIYFFAGHSSTAFACEHTGTVSSAIAGSSETSLYRKSCNKNSVKPENFSPLSNICLYLNYSIYVYWSLKSRNNQHGYAEFCCHVHQSCYNQVNSRKRSTAKAELAQSC